MDKTVTLLEVHKEGEELVLLDGRKLIVNPGDISTTCIWMPTSELEIMESGDDMYPVMLLNTGDDQKINARWVEG